MKRKHMQKRVVWRNEGNFCESLPLNKTRELSQKIGMAKP
jgi:hypothetical protein